MMDDEILLLDSSYEIMDSEEPTLDLAFPTELIDTVGYHAHVTFCDLLAMCDPRGTEP